jgi:Protein of unknown function (DUF2971)
MADTPYVQALRSRLVETLDLLAAECTAELQTLRIGRFAEQPSLLHHYTTADGVLGIISKKVIYATSAPFLNDVSEVLYGFTKARDALIAASKTSTHFFEQILFSTILATLTNIEEADIRLAMYVTCFCEKRDLLSQWRGYGANAGYSIDFRAAEMFKSRDATKQVFVKVLYDLATQDQLLASYINRSLKAFREVFELDTGDISLALKLDGPPHPALVEMQKFVNAFVGNLANLAIFFKSPTFAEESEWRVLTHGTVETREQLRFRSTRGLIYPYLEIPIQVTKSSLVSITAGPSPHGTLSKKSVRFFLDQNGLENVAVVGSEIPLKLH